MEGQEADAKQEIIDDPDEKAEAALDQQLDKLEPLETAKRADCQYQSDGARYKITFLNTEYTAELKSRQIFKAGCETEQAGFLEQLCILAYLINAKAML